MSAKPVSIAVLFLLSALTDAQQPVKCPQAGPLSEAKLTELVKGSVPAARIGQFVGSCGIDFEPTGEVIGRLRSEPKGCFISHGDLQIKLRNFLTRQGFDRVWRLWPGPTSN